MDFKELLSLAKSNKDEAAYEASVSRYNSDLPPPKKMPKSSVQSSGIKKFLEKKKAEEDARVAEAKRKKEQLLLIRSLSTKNNKKAKIMASRTKDNDFSRIRLTLDEIEAKKKREAALIRQNLDNKVERMKARIEMEEKEALLPRKRKRKSKNGEHVQVHDDNIPEEESSRRKDPSDFKQNGDKSLIAKSNGIRKAPKPPPPSLSFMELLKIAEKKQHEPLEIVNKKKVEGKPMTKKERRLKEEELGRLKRKEERTLSQNGVLSKSYSIPQRTDVSKKIPDKKTEKSKNPVVIHVEKKQSVPAQESPKFKIPKAPTNTPINKNVPIKSKEKSISTIKSSASKPSSTLQEKSIKSNSIVEQKKSSKPRVENSSVKDTRDINRSVTPSKSNIKSSPSPKPPKKKAEPVLKFDEEAIEKRIREKIEKEMEAKLLAKFGALLQGKSTPEPEKAPVKEKKISEAPKPNVVKKEPTVVKLEPKKPIEKPKMSPKEMEKILAMKKQVMERRRAMEQKPKLPEKKPFHANPYLDPPRRLLEPQRPAKQFSRRIESDDDEDEDDDMSDFIDDGCQNDDDYSKYIQEIFGYDRSRYVDDDDEDIMETSYAEQMKEEIRSAKVGYLEDLEEERKERKEMARKKKKKK